MRRRRRTWFDQWNYSAPFYWFADWIKNCKFLHRFLFYSSAIIIAIAIQDPVINTCNTVIASYTDMQKLKEAEKKQIEFEAKERERKFLEEKARKEYEYRKHQEKLEREKQDEYLRKITDLHEHVTVGDRVWITWWGKKGHVPPEGNYNVGRVTEINGFMISGNWGPEVINWEDHPNIITLSASQYREKLKKEQERVTKEQAKAEKKKQGYKSWGIYPGTIYTKNGEEWISTIENGKLVQKPYKRK